MAWGGDSTPQEAQLVQMLAREQLTPEVMVFDLGKSPEMRFERPVTYVLVEGQGFFGIPGYGSVDVNPGDIMEIEEGLFHDVTVTSLQKAKFLRALREK